MVTRKTQESLEKFCKTRPGKVRIGEGLALSRETKIRRMLAKGDDNDEDGFVPKHRIILSDLMVEITVRMKCILTRRLSHAKIY